MSPDQITALVSTLATRMLPPDGTVTSLVALRSAAIVLATLPGDAARSARRSALSMLTTHYAGRHRYAAPAATLTFCRRAMLSPPAPLLPVAARTLSIALHLSLNRLYDLDAPATPFPDLPAMLAALRALPVDARLVPSPAATSPTLASAPDGASDSPADPGAPPPIPIEVAVAAERLLVLCHDHGLTRPASPALSKALTTIDHVLVPKDHAPPPGIRFGLPDPVVRRAYALTFDPDADPMDHTLGVPVPGRPDPHAEPRAALGLVRATTVPRPRGKPGRPAAVQTPRAFWHHLANALGHHRSMRATLVSAAVQTWPAPANPDAPQLYAGTQQTSPVPDWFLWNNLRRLHTGLGLTRREFVERMRADAPVLRDMVREWAAGQPA